MTNDELDDAVLNAIEWGNQRFVDIRVHVRRKFPHRDLYRPVDRALQRLRKAGRIRFAEGKWWLV